jgi:glycosyltransferase involved in cell wall biosynthesis
MDGISAPQSLLRVERDRYGRRMDWRRHCCAIIPCLNEAATIDTLVRQVQSHLPHVIVIDDGSSDATASLATRAQARVLQHPSPQGKGAALVHGWDAARSAGFEWALTLDGDGQHAPADIPTLLSCAERTGAQLVVGNRMTNPAGMPWLRRRVNQWMSRRLSVLLGQDLPDTQNGFRLMHLASWASLEIHAAHFEIESELLCKFALAKHRIEFAPVQVIYRKERSKIRPLHDTLRWFRWWQETRRALLSRP